MGSMARKYDDVGWHDGPAMAAGQPREHGFVHIGFYLAWLIKRGLQDPAAFPPDHVAAVRDGSMTGPDLSDDVDGKLVDDVLSNEGRAFTQAAYDAYLDAYADAFARDPEYGVEDTPVNAARAERILDEMFVRWRGHRTDPAGDDSRGEDPVAQEGARADRPSVAPGRPIVVDPDVAAQAALALQQAVANRLRLFPSDVSMVPASEWGSSLVNRALKRLAIRPRDATVVSALTSGRWGSVMVALYFVPGAAAADLEREFSGALHRPSSRAWTPIEMAGHPVLRSRDEQFDVVYWAVDGVVLHLGADVDVDLSPLVAALTTPPLR